MTPRDQLARDVLLALIGRLDMDDLGFRSPRVTEGCAKEAFSFADAFLAEAARTTERLEIDPPLAVGEKREARVVVTNAEGQVARSPDFELIHTRAVPKRFAAPELWNAPDPAGWRAWSPSQRAAWSGGPEYDGSVRVCTTGNAYLDGAPEDFDWSQVTSWRPL